MYENTFTSIFLSICYNSCSILRLNIIESSALRNPHYLLAGESESQGKSRERMGREQKEERKGGGATNFFVTSVPELSRDSRLPERKRKRLLSRLVDIPKSMPDEDYDT